MPSTFRDKLMFQSYFVHLSLCSSIWTSLKPRLPYGECQTIIQSPSLASRRQLKFTNVKNHVRLVYLIECLSQFFIRVLYSIICYLSRDFLIFCKIKYKPIGEELYGSWLSTPRNQHISCFLHQSKPRIVSCHNQQQYLMRLSYLGTHLKMG